MVPHLVFYNNPLVSPRKAERERQRENEIRAFRDFSINLSSTPLPSSLGGQMGDDHDDVNFPLGPPKRAEYKAGVGVNLDALRDPTVRKDLTMRPPPGPGPRRRNRCTFSHVRYNLRPTCYLRGFAIELQKKGRSKSVVYYHGGA